MNDSEVGEPYKRTPRAWTIAVWLLVAILVAATALILAPFWLALALVRLARWAAVKRTGRPLDDGRASLLFTAGVNAFVALHTIIELMTFPPGTDIRPMDLGAMYFLVALATLFAGMLLSVRGLRQRIGAGRLVPILAMVLSLTPLLVGVASLYGMVHLRHLQFEP